METKEMRIVVPEGYEVDKEKSTFEKIIFKKIEKYSKTWEEFCVRNVIDDANESYINTNSLIQRGSNSKRNVNFDRNQIPSKFAEPMLALMQLLTIREKEYTKGWEPDWNDDTEDKYVIRVYLSEFNIFYTCRNARPLSFPTREMAEEFLKNWKGLIKIAKPLL